MVGEEISTTFIVAEFLDNDFLLGCPEMKRHNFSLDMGRGEIKSARGVENFIKLPKDLDRTCKVWCKETVVIKKNARRGILGELPARIKHNVQGIAEPKDGLAEAKSVFIANALVYGINGHIPLLCINVSDNDVTLQKGTLLAYLKPVDLGERVRKVHCVEEPSEIPDLHHEGGVPGKSELGSNAKAPFHTQNSRENLPSSRKFPQNSRENSQDSRKFPQNSRENSQASRKFSQNSDNSSTFVRPSHRLARPESCYRQLYCQEEEETRGSPQDSPKDSDDRAESVEEWTKERLFEELGLDHLDITLNESEMEQLKETLWEN